MECAGRAGVGLDEEWTLAINVWSKFSHPPSLRETLNMDYLIKGQLLCNTYCLEADLLSWQAQDPSSHCHLSKMECRVVSDHRGQWARGPASAGSFVSPDFGISDKLWSKLLVKMICWLACCTCTYALRDRVSVHLINISLRFTLATATRCLPKQICS